ncbi:MAG: hypothetical protein OXL68_02865, partial [Paracoccaceae bacterium]|nr:hypothetical protein [Paracoccaceae bacterium]
VSGRKRADMFRLFSNFGWALRLRSRAWPLLHVLMAKGRLRPRGRAQETIVRSLPRWLAGWLQGKWTVGGAFWHDVLTPCMGPTGAANGLGDWEQPSTE